MAKLSDLRAGRTLPRGRFPVLICVRGWVDPRAIVRLEELGQLKNPMNSSGIEPATFRLVTQFLNQIRYRVLRPVLSGNQNTVNLPVIEPQFPRRPTGGLIITLTEIFRIQSKKSMLKIGNKRLWTFVFWDIISCSTVELNRRFGKSFHFNFRVGE
jgi:hypothetical protein